MLVQSAYDKLLRPHLPRKIGVYNGIAVRKPRFFDLNDENWSHKSGMVRQVREAVDPGDSVVEVGSGLGVLTVHIAREATRNGRVRSFEAGRERVELATETTRLNDVAAWTDVEHAVVDGGDEIWGSAAGAIRTSIRDIADVDVLVTDCDGGERPILDALADRENLPRAAVIESHGMHGTGTDWVRAELTDLGYDVVDVRPASKKTPDDVDNSAVLAVREGR